MFIFISMFLLFPLSSCFTIFIVQTLDNIIIQTYRHRSTPYTNLYTLTKRCYWLDSKIFSQPQVRNLSTPIKEPIAFIQIQTGSLVLILVYIFNCLMYRPTVLLFSSWYNWSAIYIYILQCTSNIAVCIFITF